MSKKIISAILAIAMIVSMSATMFVTSVGAAAEATDYNTDRDALKSAIVNFTIQGPTLDADTIQYLIDLGIFTYNKDIDATNFGGLKYNEVKARYDAFGTTNVDKSYFFASDADAKLAEINDTIKYAASVWYFGTDANNELVDASFNTARNVVVKDAIEKIEKLVENLEKEVTAATKPVAYDAEFSAYIDWATTTAGYNQAFGINPYYGYASNSELFLNNTFSGSVLGQFAARWYTWDEVKAKAQPELTAFYAELQKLVINSKGYSGKTYYEFKTEVYDKFIASWEALCKALREDETAVFSKLDYTDLVNSYLQLKGVVAVFDKYISVLFNNRYTAANAELLTNVLYAKQIIEYIGTDYANKLIVMGLVDVNALIEKLVAGIAAYVPATEAAITAENVADGTALVKAAQALLDSWSNWASNDTYKGVWNALNDAKNDLVAMLPNKAGEQVLYTIPAASLKVSDVEYKSAALNIYFTPNYLSYIICAKAIEDAMKTFTATVDGITSKIDEVKNAVNDSTILRDALKKYGMLAGCVFKANDANGRLVYNKEASELYLSYLIEDFGEEPCIYDKVLFICNKGVKVEQAWKDLDTDMALDNVKAFIEMYMKAYKFYAGIEGYEDAWKDEYKFDWTKDSASFKDKYAKAVADLESTVKKLTRDLTFEITTASYIVDELAQLFGLVKDVTEDEQKEATYVEYSDITSAKVAKVYEEVCAEIAAKFAAVEAQELIVVNNTNAKHVTSETMANYKTTGEVQTGVKFVTDKQVAAVLTEVTTIIADSGLNDVIITISNDTIINTIKSYLETIFVNYPGIAGLFDSAKKSYELNLGVLLETYVNDYVENIFDTAANEYTGYKKVTNNLDFTALTTVTENVTEYAKAVKAEVRNKHGKLEIKNKYKEGTGPQAKDKDVPTGSVLVACAKSDALELDKGIVAEDFSKFIEIRYYDKTPAYTANADKDYKYVAYNAYDSTLEYYWIVTEKAKKAEADAKDKVFYSLEAKQETVPVDKDDTAITAEAYAVAFDYDTYLGNLLNADLTGVISIKKIVEKTFTDVLLNNIADTVITNVAWEGKEIYTPDKRSHETASKKLTQYTATDITADYFAEVIADWKVFYKNEVTDKITATTTQAEFTELMKNFYAKAVAVLYNYKACCGETKYDDPAAQALAEIIFEDEFSAAILEHVTAIKGYTNTTVAATLATAIYNDIFGEDGLDDSIYDKDHRLFANKAIVYDKATQEFAATTSGYTFQLAANYPTNYFKGFVDAVNAFEKIVNSTSVNQKGESTHTNVNLTDLDKAYEAVIAAANKLLTEKGESALQKFEDKVVEIYKANVGTGDFNNYEYLYDKYVAYFNETYDEAGMASGKGILSYFNVNKAEIYYYFALTLQCVLNNNDVANLYSYDRGTYEDNLLDKLEALCGDIKVADYSRAWAEDYNTFRTVASYVRDVLKNITVDGETVKLSSDMPLEYALKVLEATQAKYDEKDDNTLKAIAEYKADLNALIAKAAEVEVYTFVTDTDDAKAIWTAFTEAYAAAQKVSLDARCSKDDVDAAAEALNAALEALIAIEAPEGAATLETLNAKIDEAYALIDRADVTTDASKTALKELLIATKKEVQYAGILNSSDIAAKISAIDNAMKALKLAMFNAQNLKKEVKVLEMQVVIALYTEGSYKVFKDACDEAYAVAAADTAKESEMKAYLAKVEAKFNALVLAPVEEPVEEPAKSEVLEQAIAIYNDAAAEYATLSGYTADSVAALKAALDTLKADIENEADDAKLLESIIAVKLARAALTVVVPETCD